MRGIHINKTNLSLILILILSVFPIIKIINHLILNSIFYKTRYFSTCRFRRNKNMNFL